MIRLAKVVRGKEDATSCESSQARIDHDGTVVADIAGGAQPALDCVRSEHLHGLLSGPFFAEGAATHDRRLREGALPGDPVEIGGNIRHDHRLERAEQTCCARGMLASTI